MISDSIKEKICDDPFPARLEECLDLIAKVEYKSHGFPVVQLYYDQTFNHWSMVFRNPDGFNNPDIKEESPLEAAYTMLRHIKQCIAEDII